VGDEIIFKPNTTENLDLIEWDFGDPLSGPNNYSTHFYPVHVYALPGEYTITAKFHYLNTYQTYSKKIEIFQAPKIELGNDTTICEGDTAVFQVDDEFGTYLWNGNSCSDHFFEFSEQGSVTLEVSNVCGMDSDEAFVYVQPLPLVDLGPDIEMKYREYLTLDAGQHEEYLWMDGSTEKYYSPKNPGAVWVQVADGFGCKATDTVIISPIPFTFHVPTAFSPNGDEMNEQFKIFTTYDVQVDFDYEFFVYNRWGQEVFHTRNYPDFWDGTFNNLPCPIEVYTWILIVEMDSENDFFTKTTKLAGNVTLLR
jgi:gliding motility-associated-like protein